MFAHKFIQLRGGRAFYFQTPKVSVISRYERDYVCQHYSCNTHIHTSLGAWPFRCSLTFHNKIYEIDSDSCTRCLSHYLKFSSLSETGASPTPHPRTSCLICLLMAALIQTQMAACAKIGDWWGENYQRWCQARTEEKRPLLVLHWRCSKTQSARRAVAMMSVVIPLWRHAPEEASYRP